MKEFETQLKNAQNIKLTESERNLMRANIVNLMHQKSPKSPYSISSYFMNPVFSFVSAFVFIIIGGAGVSFSAADALPGDFLYKIKVNVNEEVAGVLISSPKQKLIWQEERIQKRISEIHTLAESGELTKKNNDLAVKALDTNIAELNKNATELATTNPEIVKAVAATIDNSTKVEIAPKLENKEATTAPAPEITSDKIVPETKIETVTADTEVTTHKEVATPKEEVGTDQKSDEAKIIAEVQSQVSILKVKIAKEKEHLESLTTSTQSSVKSDIVNTTLDIIIQ